LQTIPILRIKSALFTRVIFGIIGILWYLITSVPIFAYYSFMDLRTKSLAGSQVSSVYSNPALICDEESPSLYMGYSNLFYGLNALDNDVPGYFPPGADKIDVAAVFPYRNYGIGISHNALATALSKESKTSFLLSRNLNDFIIRKFDESIDVAVSFNMHSMEFTHFPYENYSNAATTFSWDFFMRARFGDGFEYGFAFKNLGKTDIGFKEEDPLPREFNFSAAKNFSKLKLIFSYQDSLQMPDYGLGAEYGIGSLTVMTGINSNYFSVGAAMKVKERLDFLLGISMPFIGDAAFQPDLAVRYYFSKTGTRDDKAAKMKMYYDKAHEAYVNERFQEAVENWRQVLKIEPSHYLSKKNIIKAVSASKKYYFSMATNEYKQGNYEKAIELWQKVLEIDPGHALSKAKIEKAQEMIEKGFIPTPSEELNKQAAKQKLFNQATTEYLKGNYEKAIELWQKVLEIDPEHNLSKIKIKSAEDKLKNPGVVPEGKINGR